MAVQRMSVGKNATAITRMIESRVNLQDSLTISVGGQCFNVRGGGFYCVSYGEVEGPADFHSRRAQEIADWIIEQV